MKDVIKIVEPPALDAAVLVHAAVQLVDIAVARLPVQAVDVLRDQARELSRALERIELPVRGVGLRLRMEHVLAVERVKPIGVQVKKRLAEHHLRRELAVLLPVQPVLPGEIRDARRGAHARAAEEHDALCPVDHLLKL